MPKQKKQVLFQVCLLNTPPVRVSVGVIDLILREVLKVMWLEMSRHIKKYNGDLVPQVMKL